MKKISLLKLIGAIGTAVGTGSLIYFLNKDSEDENPPKQMSLQKTYSADGFDEDGFDKNGYDREGYDRDGFNRNRLDRNGYDKAGYKNGFDRTGHNRYGFLKSGYNDEGFDVSGYDTPFYFNEVSRMSEQIVRAKRQMDINEFDYALNDIRVGLEIGAKNFIRHYIGKQKLKETLYDNLKTCRRYLPENLYDRLQSARHQCSPTQHDTDERGNKSYNQVYFAWKTLDEFRDYIQNHLVTGAEVLYV